MNDAEVSRAFADSFGGIAQLDELPLELSNEDGYFNGLDLRGELMELRRFDRIDAEQFPEFVGHVIDQTLHDDRIVLRVASQDLDALQTLLPKRLVTAAVFPFAHATAGLNLPIPIIFGNAAKVELPFVNDNVAVNVYLYLVGEGTPTVMAVYRDTVGGTIALVPPAEYTIDDGLFPGYRTVKFTKRQVNFSGGLHRIFADLSGPALDRNFVRAIQTLLSNSTYGLGLSVETNSFNAGASALDSIGGLFCDGAIVEQRPAIDYLNQLLMVRGMRIAKNTAGQRVISVDTAQSTIRATFGHGKGQPWRNVREFGGLSKTPLDDAVKTLFLDYRLDLRTNTYQLSASRSVLSKGREKRIQHDFIRDRTTGDKTVDYLGKRLLHGDQRLSFTAGQEARRLVEGDLIQYESSRVGLAKPTMRVTKIRRRIEDVALEVEGWNVAIYTYTPGTLPAEPISDIDVDTSRTTPAPVTSLIISSSGSEQATDGTTLTFVVLQYTVPAEDWAETQVKFRRTGTTIWQIAAVEGVTGAGKQTRINGLTPGLTYDYAVERVNSLTPTLRSITTLSSQLAPGDTTAPPAPTAIAVRQGTGKDVEIDLTFAEPDDWSETLLYRNTSNNSATAAPIDRGKKKRFHDVNVSYGTTYFYWAKVADLTYTATQQSGNISGFSPSLSHSITVQQINASLELLVASIVTSLLADGSVSTAKLANLAATNAKIANLAVDSLKLSDQAVTSLKRQLVNTQSVAFNVPAGNTHFLLFSVATGVVNMVTPIAAFSSGTGEMAMWLNQNIAGQVQVAISNFGTVSQIGTLIIHYW